MRYKIAICDDCDVDRQYISNMVTLWGERSGHIVHIDRFSSAEQFLFCYAEEGDYDILLLDIEMGTMDGVTMAKSCEKKTIRCKLCLSQVTPTIFWRAMRWRRFII